MTLRKYCYGNLVTLGEETDFQLFLAQMHLGNIYYDPGIKMENISVKPVVKRRSQFRMSSQFLGSLYKRNEVVDVLMY
ncbi:MAG: MvaI/BcnI restriction endonuclease family protein [Bacteroidetes bacterium]|nr:MvaI/BcnI restriction endonuclease family protein [Bacteroidota bacterium]